MNVTQIVYESILSDSMNETAEIVLSTLMCLGLINHIYMGVVLLKTTIPSILTKFLLYLQNAIEGLFAIMVIVQTNTRNFTPTSSKVPVNPILCYLFQSGAWSIVIRVMSYCNILCQSADIYLAIIYPHSYRVHIRYYITMFSTISFVYSVLASIPRIAKVSLIEGSCQLKSSSISTYVVTALECLLVFAIPTSIFVPINVALIRKLFKIKILTFRKSNRDHPSQGSCNFEKGWIKKMSDPSASLQKSLLINTFFVAMAIIFTECVFLVLTISNLYGVIRYDAGAVARVYFSCCIVLIDSLNSTMRILTTKALRRTACSYCKFVCRFHRKRREDSQDGVNGI